MNATELYQEIKDALATFGLHFNEMDKVEVTLNDDAITFRYANQSVEVKWLNETNQTRSL